MSTSDALYYDFTKSTRENYAASSNEEFGYAPDFAATREACDRVYHGKYSRAREAVQDEIIRNALAEESFHHTARGAGGKDERPWIILSSGVMGVGKTRSTRWLSSKGIADLSSTVLTDPDRIKWKLPLGSELGGRSAMAEYLRWDADTAATRTHAESAYVVEILRHEAIRRGRSVVIDGSMRHAKWWAEWIVKQRAGIARPYRFALWHFVASPEKVFQRAAHRGVQTGRHVPTEVIARALSEVPHSIEKLLPLVDVAATISTDDDRFPRLLELRANDSVAGVAQERAANMTRLPSECPLVQPPISTLTGVQLDEWRPFAELFGAPGGIDRSQRSRRKRTQRRDSNRERVERGERASSSSSSSGDREGIVFTRGFSNDAAAHLRAPSSSSTSLQVVGRRAAGRLAAQVLRMGRYGRRLRCPPLFA